VARDQFIQKAAPCYKLNPPPEYPRIARRRGIEGTVIIKVLVDDNGRAAKTIVSETSGYAVLDRAAKKDVRRWAFRPGTINGRKQAMWVEVPIKFQLQEGPIH
jgi:protein TonB